MRALEEDRRQKMEYAAYWAEENPGEYQPEPPGFIGDQPGPESIPYGFFVEERDVSKQCWERENVRSRSDPQKETQDVDCYQ